MHGVKVMNQYNNNKLLHGDHLKTNSSHSNKQVNGEKVLRINNKNLGTIKMILILIINLNLGVAKIIIEITEIIIIKDSIIIKDLIIIIIKTNLGKIEIMRGNSKEEVIEIIVNNNNLILGEAEMIIKNHHSNNLLGVTTTNLL